MNPDPNNHQLPPRQILGIVIVVLGGIILGTLFTMRFQGPRPANRPTALGHVVPSPPRPRPAGPATEMVLVPAATFRMGSDHGATDERPVHDATFGAFWMDRTEVTNADFAKFAAATGYVTTAEKPPNTGLGLKELGDAVGGVPGSFILERAPDNDADALRWRWVAGANWRQPEGPGSSTQGREDHPVVHVSWLDASAYASWAKKRLPTEAEWEHAARAGAAAGRYVWGDRVETNAGAPANFWQVPAASRTLADTFGGTAPVGRFSSNPFGLFDLAGNVAEWCADWYREDYFSSAPAKNPAGPEASLDPAEPNVAKKVVRGGSYVTSDPAEWRLTARFKRSPYVSYSDVGFRCARSVK